MNRHWRLHCSKYTITVLSVLLILISCFIVYATQQPVEKPIEHGEITYELNLSVTFIALSLIAVFILAIIGTLCEQVVIITTTAVIVGILFIMGTILICTVFIINLTRYREYHTKFPFLPAIAIVIMMYVVSMSSIELKDQLKDEEDRQENNVQVMGVVTDKDEGTIKFHEEFK